MNFKQRLAGRIRAVASAALNIVVKMMDGDIRKRAYEHATRRLEDERCNSREQWHRWYQANRRRQRQMAAYKRLGGGPINPNATGLLRWMVP